MHQTLALGMAYCLAFVINMPVAFALDVAEPIRAIPKDADVVIVGAGLSGLTTAYGLADQKVVILESTPRIGGRVSTISYDIGGETVLANEGMEEFWGNNPIIALIEEFKLEVRITPAISSFMLNGKLFELKPGETKPEFLARVFSSQELLNLREFEAMVEKASHRSNSESGIPRDLVPLKNISFAQWVSEQHLSNDMREYVRIHLEPEIATDWRNISAIDGIVEFQIFLSKGEKSYAIVGGNQLLTDKLTSAIGKEKIFTGTLVEQIVSVGGGVDIHYKNLGTGERNVIRAANVVTTLPLPVLNTIKFQPALSAEKQAAIGELSEGHYLKVHLILKNSARRFFVNAEGDSILPILTDTPIGVVYEGNAQQASNGQMITLLLHGKAAEEFNALSKQDAEARLMQELGKVFPGIEGELLGLHILKRLTRQVASWEVGRSRFDAKSGALRVPENGIYIAGDFTESSHSDGAARAALRVVTQIRKFKNLLVDRMRCAGLFFFPGSLPR